jgi:uncharacterized membrane protein YeaQ/YmgE (transglycosylase-associated protein family)
MPGRQNIGVVMTVILGAIGAFVGTWVSYKLGHSNQNGGFKTFRMSTVSTKTGSGITQSARATRWR